MTEPDVDTLVSGPLSAVEAEMRRALEPAGHAHGMYTGLMYHLGWADGHGNPTEARRGKQFRPRLCLAACAAAGQTPDNGVAFAAAVELTHEFSLIHDDLQDGDRTRRGRPAAWTVYGAAQAITLGDALFAVARRTLMRAPVSAEVLVAAASRYDEACLNLAEGQFMDLELQRTKSANVQAYVKMVEGKTGALLSCAAALGALAGGATGRQADAYADFGLHLGVAFQIVDDVLGLWGDPELTGKPAGRDLVNAKASYPLVLARQQATGERALAQAHGLAAGSAEVQDVLNRLRDLGYKDSALRAAGTRLADALSALDASGGGGEGKAALTALARQSLDRAF